MAKGFKMKKNEMANMAMMSMLADKFNSGSKLKPLTPSEKGGASEAMKGKPMPEMKGSGAKRDTKGKSINMMAKPKKKGF